MSKTLRTIGTIAGVVALTVATAGAFAPAGATILGASFATVAAVASAASAVAMAGSQALQKPPDMKGTISEVVIGSNMPVPYAMGRTYIGGMKVYDDSQNDPSGGLNKDRNQIFVGSHAGPIDSYEKFYGDYSPITFSTEADGFLSGTATGFYGADGGYLWLTTRKGYRPDVVLATSGGRTTPRGWTADHKLSGMPSWLVTMEFDEDGTRFASGIPAWGVVAKWVLAYDPRLDDTYPGGSGPQRWDNEATWAWSENPGVHGLTYARGRFMGPNNVKVVGAGIPQDAIDLAAFVEFANVCDANGWTVGGAVYEGPGSSKWDNLKRILDAGAAKPVWVGGMLTLSISAPKVALDLVTSADLTEGDVDIPAMAPWKGKFNTIVPRYRSEDHRWEYVQAAAVTSSTYLAEDGEVKSDERQYDLIQDVDQAAQRAAYDLANEREIRGIRLPLKPRLKNFRIGEALDLDFGSLLDDPALGTRLAVITGRRVDPSTSAVVLEFDTETNAKHAFALGQTGVSPPTPSIAAPEDVDQAVGAPTDADIIQMILGSSIENLTFSVDSTGAATISTHDRIYPDKTVSVTGGTAPAPSGTVAGDVVAVIYRQQSRAGGAVTYEGVRIPGGVGELPKPSASDPYLHPVAIRTVPASGSSSGGSGLGGGGGSGGGGGGWGNPEP